MKVIGIHLLMEFMEHHPEEEHSIIAWLQILHSSEFHNIKDLSQSFPKITRHGALTVFEVGSVLIVTLLHLRQQRVYIRSLLREQEYVGGVRKA